MKKKRRFTKEFEIQAEILKYKRKLKEHLIEAERMQDMSDEEFRKSCVTTYGPGERSFFADNGRIYLTKARKHRRSAFLIESKALPRLKETLAAFNTKPMEFMGKDHSVMMEDA